MKGRRSLPFGGGGELLALAGEVFPAFKFLLVPGVRLEVVSAERNAEVDPAGKRALLFVRDALRVSPVELLREEAAHARAVDERRQRRWRGGGVYPVHVAALGVGMAVCIRNVRLDVVDRRPVPVIDQYVQLHHRPFFQPALRIGAISCIAASNVEMTINTIIPAFAIIVGTPSLAVGRSSDFSARNFLQFTINKMIPATTIPKYIIR